MLNIFKKVVLSICIYISLMVIVSGGSRLFNNKDSFSLYSGTKFSKEVSELETNTQLEEQVIAEGKSTATIPFDFSVNITEEQAEQKQNIAFSFLFADIPHYDVYEELEKRKCKFIYQRKFALCILKQKLKRFTPHKWRIKEDKLCL